MLELNSRVIESIENFFREFFNDDRTYHHGTKFFAVVFGPSDPSSDLADFLLSGTVDHSIVYRKGSVMSADDMKRISAEKALAFFFLCDSKAYDKAAYAADMELALQILAVQSYVPTVEIFSQVRSERYYCDDEVSYLLFRFHCEKVEVCWPAVVSMSF